MNKKVSIFKNKLFTVALFSSGIFVAFVAFAILFFLGKEGSSAFDRKFTYGFRIAAQPLTGGEELDIDPYSSVLASSPDATEGEDDKESGISMPTIEELKGTVSLASGTALTGDLAKMNPESLFKEDWREPMKAENGAEFLLYVFGTSEQKDDKFALVWGPDIDFDPSASPHNFELVMVSGPAGASFKPIDLKKQPKGRIELPAFIAKTDKDRTKGYVLKLKVTSGSTNQVAVLRDFFSSVWTPTAGHARFGVMPLLLSTLLMTFLAVLMSAPLSIMCSIYLREYASESMRNILKPVIELLASVPTVVLGYFGLLMIAPFCQQTLAKAFSMESGRCLFTTSVVMAILLIPTITTVVEDALDRVPNWLRDGAEGLGLTKAESLCKVVVPAAKSGTIAALILATGRAIGETMIVWVLSGGTVTMPSLSAKALGQPTRGMADAIMIDVANVDFGGVHYGYLFLMGLTLFLITLVFNTIGFRMARKAAWRE